MFIEQNSRGATALLMQNWLSVFCFVGTALLISWLLKYSSYGIDFTDESFYLVWISNPFTYDGSITQFGFLYHPLYILLDGDIASLRQVNVLITFALAWGLTYFYFVSISADLKENRITQLAVSAACASSVLIQFNSWLLTPSYNSLNLQGLLITAIGLVLAEKTLYRTSIFGWLLIGIGGWLVFMAKPSSALALAVSVFIYLFLANMFSIRKLALSAICALVLILASALVIDGSLADFIKRLTLGVEFSKLMEGGYTLSNILRIDNFQLDAKFILSIFMLIFTLFIALSCVCVKNKKLSFISLLISIAFFIVTALLTTGQIFRTVSLGKFQGLLMFGLFFALIIAMLAMGRLRALNNISAQQWAIATLFLAMPHIYAFGTNGNYWQAGSSAAIFWLLSGLTFLAPLIREQASWSLTLPVAFAAQAVTATLLQTGLEQPYLQTQPLRLNESILEIGPQRSKIVLSKDYAKYFYDAEVVFREARFKPSTPMIDLSGQSPGILYSVGAENIGQAWTIGGYPGSLNLAKATLSRTSCKKIAASWVLFEHDGPRNIPVELMLSLGANFPNNYESVGIWQTAEGSGGYPYRRTQELFKPVTPSETLKSCMQLRNSQG